MISNLRIAVVVILFLITFGVLHMTDSVKEVPIKRPLSEFPKEIGPWTRINQREHSEGVVNMLNADDYIDYTYAAPDGRGINLYVSYFESVGIHGGYHSPKNCLPGGGWNIAEIRPLTLNVRHSKSEPVQVSLMVVQQGDELQLTVYWYQNRGRIIASEYWEKIYLVMDALFKGRRDGSFIRIMAPTTKENMQETIASLKAFSEKSIPLLDTFIPGKDG